MNGLVQHFVLSLRLQGRNRMGLVYGYLFPLVYLAVFRVLYRYEDVPLLRHLGELLTVSVLGGACFGLPTTLVSERERGVWRRYRLLPVAPWRIVTSTMLARYVVILSAGLLQFGVARVMGMTAPAHPLALVVAFTLVAFALLGLGLVIAALADNVPAVQALGQCIFLPMLVIGGVAVPLASLPDWAQHGSAFFPGRYAVEALQAAVTGPGLAGMRFSLLALALTGAAGMLAGAKLFRWDAQQRFAATAGKTWIAPVFAVWIAVGLLTEMRGRSALAADAAPAGPVTSAPTQGAAAPWEAITMREVAALNYRVPPDGGVVAPMALPGEEPDRETVTQLNSAAQLLPYWPPANTGDEVQRIRNLLCVAAVPDVVQQPAERFLPAIVLQRLTATYPHGRLVRMLTWIATHPEDGTVLTDISSLGVSGVAGDPDLVRQRVYFYSIKFIARLTGRPANR